MGIHDPCMNPPFILQTHPGRFAHISNEILLCWISCEHIWSMSDLYSDPWTASGVFTYDSCKIRIRIHGGPIDDLHIFQMKYAHFGSDVNTFTHSSTEILKLLKNLYPLQNCIYFKWNIKSLEWSAHDATTIAHVSHEIFAFWIRWNTFTHISNAILTFLKDLCFWHNCTYFKRFLLNISNYYGFLMKF